MINLKLEDLIKMVNELVENEVDYVEISISESENFEGHVLPASLKIGAYDGFGGVVDYEGIEEVKVDAFYKFSEPQIKE